MEGNIAKISYIKAELEKKLVEGISPEKAKQEIRKAIMDVMAQLPQDINTLLHDIFCPSSVREQKLLDAIFGSQAVRPPRDKMYLCNINKPLPPQETLIKDEARVYKQMSRALKACEHILSQQTIQYIKERIEIFLKKRNWGVKVVYTYKDNPEQLLQKLLSAYIPLDDESGECDEQMKGYLDNNQARIYLDPIYGAIYLLLAPSLVKRYSIGAAGNFGNQFIDLSDLKEGDLAYNEEDEEENIDDTLSVSDADFGDAYVIFGKISKNIEEIIVHEKQHMMDNIVFDYQDNDFLSSGQDEILACIKQGISSEKTLHILYKTDTYDFYKKHIDCQQKNIEKYENKIKGSHALKTPAIIMADVEIHLEHYKTKLEKYIAIHLPLWEEYKLTIDIYIKIAYKLKAANINNYLEILMVTPIRKRPELMDIYMI